MNRRDPDTYSKAWDFATKAHEGQSYGGPEEGERVAYINHISSVAMEVIWAITDTQEKLNADLAIQCALLHDVVEDTEYEFADIKRLFGENVANGVAALSKNETLPTKEEQMRDSLERIKHQPKEVWMVKMADRITNLYHPPFYWKSDKILKYCEESKVIYDELSDANTKLAKRLAEKIRDYPKFAEGRA